MRNAALLSCAFALLPVVYAHIEMTWPYPIRSKYDPETPSNLIDYSMTSPLLADGSNYPCKGYNTDTPTHTVNTYDAGSSYNMTLAGTATHGGGSCQLSLSYDNGKTFKVIESMIGGCPLTETYKFTIPSSAPSGNALFAWTWFNLIGNREMYMDCARVQIDSPSGSEQKFDGLPNIYLANIGDKAECTTIENEQTVFPNPGSEVIYGSGVTSSTPKQPGTCKDGSDGSSDSPSGSSASDGPRSGSATAGATGSIDPMSMPTTFATVVTSRASSAGVSSLSDGSFAPITTGEVSSAIASSGSAGSFAPVTTAAVSSASESTIGEGSFMPSFTTGASLSANDTLPTSVRSISSLPTIASGTRFGNGTQTSSAAFFTGLFSPSTFMTSVVSAGATGASSVPRSGSASTGLPSMLPPPPKPTICVPNTPVCNTNSTSTSGSTGSSSNSTSSSDGVSTQWSLCSSLGTSLIPMGSLAPGTACLPDGTIGRDPRSPNGGLCSANMQGMMRCGANDQMWLVCDDRAWVNMGKVADGTVCVGGRIVAARSS